MQAPEFESVVQWPRQVLGDEYYVQFHALPAVHEDEIVLAMAIARRDDLMQRVARYGGSHEIRLLRDAALPRRARAVPRGDDRGVALERDDERIRSRENRQMCRGAIRAQEAVPGDRADDSTHRADRALDRFPDVVAALGLELEDDRPGVRNWLGVERRWGGGQCGREREGDPQFEGGRDRGLRNWLRWNTNTTAGDQPENVS